MREIDNSDLILFVHVGQTGGESLIELARREYLPHEILWGGNRYSHYYQLLSQMDHTRLQRMKLIAGHTVFYGMHHLISRPCQYFSFLRDPVRHTISSYFRMRIRNDQPAVFTNRDFLEFLSTGLYRAKFVCEMLGLWNWDNDVVRLVDKLGPFYLEHMTQVAKNIIDNEMQVVGICEEYDLSAFLYGRALGWDAHRFWELRFKTSGKSYDEEISEKSYALIKEMRRHDIELYEHAKNRLMAQYEALSDEEKQAFEVFKEGNALYQTLRTSEYPLSPAFASFVARSPTAKVVVLGGNERRGRLRTTLELSRCQILDEVLLEPTGANTFNFQATPHFAENILSADQVILTEQIAGGIREHLFRQLQIPLEKVAYEHGEKLAPRYK